MNPFALALGLPVRYGQPGPIDSPGLASIEAAAHPANVPYLYYVVKPGTCPPKHFFTDSDAEFQQAVARYNAAREATMRVVVCTPLYRPTEYDFTAASLGCSIFDSTRLPLSSRQE